MSSNLKRMSSTIDLYAIHDAWFNSMIDGDVDDRAAIKFYEKLMIKNPNIKIMVYFTDNRYNVSKSYYQNSNIIFCENFDIEDVKRADKIGVFAKIKDATIRSQLVEVISEKKNGYCQGDQIGAYNFPDDSYAPLLNSMRHKFSTDLTKLSFPSSFLDVLDPEYKDDYLSYGLLKLIAIGGIIKMPNLVYRLYCPGIGGGPGTNMLKIQEWFKEQIPALSGFSIDAGNFQTVNDIILNDYLAKEKSFEMFDQYEPLARFMESAATFKSVKIGDKTVDINLEALGTSLKVMILFGNLIYKPKEGSRLFDSGATEFYSLTNMPAGDLIVSFEDTPPLYDLVAAYCLFYDRFTYDVKGDIIKFFETNYL